MGETNQSMASDLICQKCGTRVRADAPGELCPRCLLVEALAPERSDSGQSEDEVDVPPLRKFGDYDLLNQIARGGMGVVYRARQISANRLVAVKMISAGELATPEQIGRFKTEAEAA